jgi:hypothetical protein
VSPSGIPILFLLLGRAGQSSISWSVQVDKVTRIHRRPDTGRVLQVAHRYCEGVTGAALCLSESPVGVT